MFQEDEYPEPQELESKFQLDMPLRKTPDTSDLKNRLIGADRARNEESLKKATKEAVKDIYSRFQKQLNHIVEKLKTAGIKEENAKKQKHFKDTLITNLIDLVDLMPILNVTKDPELEKIAESIKNDICVYDADVLRDSVQAREEVIEKADTVLAQMNALFA